MAGQDRTGPGLSSARQGSRVVKKGDEMDCTVRVRVQYSFGYRNRQGLRDEAKSTNQPILYVSSYAHMRRYIRTGQPLLSYKPSPAQHRKAAREITLDQFAIGVRYRTVQYSAASGRCRARNANRSDALDSPHCTD